MKYIYYTLFLFYILIPTELYANDDQQSLLRRAQWNAQFKTIKNISGKEIIAKEIVSLKPESALSKAGLNVSDQLISLDGITINDSAAWDDINNSLVAGKNIQLTYIRQNKLYQTILKFNAVVKENYPNIETYYDQIINDSSMLQRVIITKPQNKIDKQPAIFVVQGLSCSSIEHIPGRTSNFIKTLQNIIQKSNMVVMRVEKPGMGDSEGNCSKTDFHTELSGYEKALIKLQSLDYVDTNKIIVYGSSMGSAIAPYLANKYQLNGIISDGTFYRSWFEHMLEIERRIKTMQGLKQDEISLLMNQVYIPLYYEMLIKKKSYAEIVTTNPMLAKHNYHDPLHMYGRPMSYYHQLQDFDFAGHWQKITAPVRIRWGTNDWIMSEYDNDMIEEMLSNKGHKDFIVHKYPNLDHWYTIHESASNSFLGKNGQWQDKISQQIIDWVIEINN